MATRSVPKATNLMIQSIADTVVWAGNEVSYAFLKTDLDDNGINDFDEGIWRSFYIDIFDNVSSFANLKFVEKPEDQADLREFLNVGEGAYSGVPGDGVGVVYTTVDIQLPVAEASLTAYLGSEYWYHEIGHSLGLLHSFEIGPDLIDEGVSGPDDLGENFLSSDLYTTMSYQLYVWGEDNPFTSEVDVGGTLVNASAGSYMPIDIAALQHMYGKVDHATGNNRYVFTDDRVANRGITTIWDTGGKDTIAYEGASRAKIDLRAATLEHEIGGGGFFSTSELLTGGFLIGHGVTIENAVGGALSDFLIGNAVANELRGLNGDDVLSGLGGNDKIFGGNGSDILSGGAGNDRLSGGSGSDVFFYGAGDTGRDSIVDFGMNDVLVSTSKIHDANGDGRIDVGPNGRLDTGRASIDVVGESGGAVRSLEYDGTFAQGGVSYYVYSRVGSTVGVNEASAHDYIQVVSTSPTLSQYYTGNSENNDLSGNNIENVIDGSTGADRMTGGQGDDVYYVDNINDKVIELQGSNEGFDTIYSSVSYKLAGTFVEQLILTGDSNINATGNAQDNILEGNKADNVLDGKAGADTMTGGRGDDTYYVDNPYDVVIETQGVAQGNDTVYASASYSLFNTFVETLALTGAGDIDATGNGQANTLIGNVGDNVLTGGGGRDTFVFTGDFGSDRVADFDTSADVIRFGAGTFTSYDHVIDRASQVGSDVVIALDADNVVTLQGVSLGTLEPDHFLFA